MSAERLADALTVALDDLGVPLEHRSTVVELAARVDELLHAGQCPACSGAGAVAYHFPNGDTVAMDAELCPTCHGTGAAT